MMLVVPPDDRAPIGHRVLRPLRYQFGTTYLHDDGGPGHARTVQRVLCVTVQEARWTALAIAERSNSQAGGTMGAPTRKDGHGHGDRVATNGDHARACPPCARTVPAVPVGR